jgi:hypothetical protein
MKKIPKLRSQKRREQVDLRGEQVGKGGLPPLSDVL